LKVVLLHLIKKKIDMNNSQVPRLITIGISHYCEKVRWALDWQDISYIEESHAPPFHRIYTRRYEGTTVPILVTNDGNFTDSTNILDYLNNIAAKDRKLYPDDPQLREEVNELEELFDTKLGVATRSWGYFQALKNPLQILIVWGKQTPLLEKIGCAIAFPYTVNLVRKKYKILPEEATNSLQIIREIFESIDRQLQTGKEYLVGDSFSAADLTFASLAAPILRPHNHPFYSSKIEKIDRQVAEVIEELRETIAGKFVLRLYREQRK
jgi:glutathione S-transferase